MIDQIGGIDVLGDVGEHDLLHAARGTNVVANAASLTLIIINLCQIIRDGDGIVGASLLTLHAADAGVLTVLASISALFGVAAHDHGLSLLRDHGNDLLGADDHAHAASEATGGIYVGDTVLQANGVGGAGLGAVAQAEASEAAGIGAAVEHRSALTGGDAVVGSLLGGSLTVAVAMDECHEIGGSLYLDTQDLAQLLGGGFSTGNAQVGSMLSGISYSL